MSDNDPWRSSETPWRESVPASVVDEFTPGGDEIHASRDRRMLWHVESFLATTGTTQFHRDKQLALYRYLCETCQHEWSFYAAEGQMPALRQCLWCSRVELCDEHPDFDPARS